MGKISSSSKTANDKKIVKKKFSVIHHHHHHVVVKNKKFNNNKMTQTPKIIPKSGDQKFRNQCVDTVISKKVSLLENISSSENLDFYFKVKEQRKISEKYQDSLKILSSDLTNVFLEKKDAKDIFLQRLNISTKSTFQSEIFKKSLLADVYEVFCEEFRYFSKSVVIEKFFPFVY